MRPVKLACVRGLIAAIFPLSELDPKPLPKTDSQVSFHSRESVSPNPDKQNRLTTPRFQELFCEGGSGKKKKKKISGCLTAGSRVTHSCIILKSTIISNRISPASLMYPPPRINSRRLLSALHLSVRELRETRRGRRRNSSGVICTLLLFACCDESWP